jgi:hypothetical protein
MATLAALLHSPEWYAGGSPPARYLIPLLPAFVLTWALLLKTPVRWRRLGEVVLAPSVVMWWALVTRPQFSINPGDGSWWLARLLARRLSADIQVFVPSFLVPTAATAVVPLVSIVVIVAALACCRRATATRLVIRSATAIWLIAAAVVTAAAVSRCDRVVEAEAGQVRRFGGESVPVTGTVSKYRHPSGWRVGNGGGLAVPLKLGPASSVLLEGWLEGTARQGASVLVRWNDGPTTKLAVGGAATAGRLALPEPPGPGRHRLTVTFRGPRGGTAVFDRVLVERLVTGRGSAPTH